MTTAPERQAAARPASDGFVTARKSMIDSQLRTSGVNAPFVLSRMMSVPREDHVPAAARGVAYIDRAVPLGDGRYLAAPVFHGMLLQEAAPKASDRVLIVDGGSGYLPALVGPLVASLETIGPAQAVAGEGPAGPFSLLLIDGAVEHVPPALAARVEADGRAVIGIVNNGVTRLAVGRRTGSDEDAALALLPLAEIGIPVLEDFAAPKGWTF